MRLFTHLSIFVLAALAYVNASENRRETNGDRMRRGLGPGQPSRLWTRTLGGNGNGNGGRTPTRRQILPAATTLPVGTVTTFDVFAGRQYRLTAQGGSGGSNIGGPGSRAALTVIQFTAPQNATITGVVARAGAQQPNATPGGSGGGGTFVYRERGNGALPILVAGGGAGRSIQGAASTGGDAITDPALAGSGQGGTNNNGGCGPGAGWFTDGAPPQCGFCPGGGMTGPTWQGGQPLNVAGSATGGFGGGGGGCTSGSGAGAGFTGGSASSTGGMGGTTYVATTLDGAPITFISSTLAATGLDGMLVVETLT